MDKETVKIGCKTIQGLVSYIEHYTDWSNFTPEERESMMVDVDFTKKFVEKLLEESK